MAEVVVSVDLIHEDVTDLGRLIRVIAGEFAADGDYSTWREHGTADWLLIHTIAGAGRVAGPAGDVITAAGDSILLRPHVRHDYGTAEDSWTLAYAHFHARAEWAPLLDWPIRGGGIGLVHAPSEVRLRILGGLRSCAAFSAGSMSQSELPAILPASWNQPDRIPPPPPLEPDAG